ncbi:MAG: hypothetical protein COV43_02835 [Deltaproteobacteria bacterium CG11_big_fil_rev_8_21_14_0_20_42_23]|nr:MAG: hypothetical protein COV43_02835 [Deltaproteobacteria bacterium CG11_big_fil_rev_8_21_14_0_20_42_23]PJC64423.1 MAG: hypothetical protein CO021_04395 [Deltaproteobacteria bacterium CG_4_9_14_0_2_um_filter_42_21]
MMIRNIIKYFKVSALFFSVALLVSCGGNKTPSAENASATGDGARGSSQFILPANITPQPGMGVLVLGVIGPDTTTAIISGPDDFNENREVNASEPLLLDLNPGTYMVAVSQVNGWNLTTSNPLIVNLEEGMVEVGVFEYEMLSDSRAPPVASYRGADGQLVQIREEDMTDEHFVFYAWLRDQEGGIDPTLLTALPAHTTPPLEEEQRESAPSFTQNLAAAFIGYKDDTGNVFPIIGANVRWQIEESASYNKGYRERSSAKGRIGFGATGGGGNACGQGPAAEMGCVDNNQAATYTANGSIRNTVRFPLAVEGASSFPFFNLTGILSPDLDGLAWVTLFSLDVRAEARVAVIGFVNGTEIGKTVLYKKFIPKPKIEVEKTVEVDGEVRPDEDVTFTVRISNSGLGVAHNITLEDRLASGNDDVYSLSAPGGTAPVGDSGFDTTGIDLAPGEHFDFVFTASASATGAYCNEAKVISFTDEEDELSNVSISDQACFEVVEPNVTILKDFVDAEGQTLGDHLIVTANTEAMLRVRLINDGTGTAHRVRVTDRLVSDVDLTQYEITQLPDATDGVNQDASEDGSFEGWDDERNDGDFFTLLSGDSVTYLFKVVAHQDDVYCDLARFIYVDGPDDQTEITGESQACLDVRTPHLRIVKENNLTIVNPGRNYSSTITLTNVGAGIAHDVLLEDRIGLGPQPDNTIYVELVSADRNGEAGVFSPTTQTVGFTSIDLNPGDSVTALIVSRVPDASSPGQYCDIGKFNSSDAGSGEAQACITVPSFVALQTQLVDSVDPLRLGESTTYSAVLYNESRSNSSAHQNLITYSFGLDDPSDAIGTAGYFVQSSTQLYRDTAPVQNTVTGLIVSDSSNASAALLTEGVDYTLTTDTQGLQVITFNSSFTLAPNEAIYMLHESAASEGTPDGNYTTGYIWNSNDVTDDTALQASSSEPTTVLE